MLFFILTLRKILYNPLFLNYNIGMKQRDYYETREINCVDRLNNIIKDLPYYVEDFFIGTENRTQALTRLNYGYDLRVFFNFLSKKIYRNKKMSEIELSDLDNLKSSDIEYYISYLSHYEINGKYERCTETGKARKLSSLRAFYKYFFNKNVQKYGNVQIPSSIPTLLSASFIPQ